MLSGDDLVRAGLVAGRGASDCTLERRHASTTASGGIAAARRSRPSSARPQPRRRLAARATSAIYDADMNVVRRLPAIDGARRASRPSQLTLAKVDPDELDYLDAASDASRELEARRPARPTKPAPAWGTRSRARCRRC